MAVRAKSKTKQAGAWKFLEILGPGLITGASDDDPSGIATYAQAGAQFGYGLGWTMFFSYPLMCAIQLISAEIGRVTGVGIAGNLRKHYAAWILHILVGLLIVANVINLGADLGAMGVSIRLLVDGPQFLYVGIVAVVSAFLEIYVCYSRYAPILKWLTLSLFAYVATAFVVDMPWGTVARELFWPHILVNGKYLTTVVAVFGTTISPYLFFWQADTEVERERAKPGPNSLKATPYQAVRELRRIRLDTFIGMGFSNLIAIFIILTTAATLHASGHTDIQSSAQAAEALKPVAGRFAYTVFALGIIGTGLLGVPVLAGSAAYALGEALKWPVGLEHKPNKAKAFYITLAAAIAIGVLLNFTPIDPIKALFWSAVINGVVAPPVMVMIMLMASNKKIMGQFTLRPLVKVLGWAATLVMGFVAMAMIVTWKS